MNKANITNTKMNKILECIYKQRFGNKEVSPCTTLMHKEIPVVDIELDDASGAITRVDDVHNAAHIPIGIAYKNDILDRKALNKWWYGRSIPASRQGIQQALAILRIGSTQELIDKKLRT